MPGPVPQLITLQELATALCVSPHTVRSWVKKGRLRRLPLCRRLIFDPDEVKRFLKTAASIPTEEEISLHDGTYPDR